MAYSYNKYIGDGSTTGPFTVSFPYIDKSHVHVYVQGVEQPADRYEWVNSGAIRFFTAPLLNEVIIIQRNTKRDGRMVDYQTGSILNESTLDLDSTQLFYVMQEAFDLIVKSKDQDGLVFHDREAILDAINGWIDQSKLADDLQNPLDYLADIHRWDALFESNKVLEPGIVDTDIQRVPQAHIAIDEAKAQIALKAGQVEVDALGTRLTNAEIDIDGLQAEIVLKAATATVTSLETRVSAAELDIDGLQAEIVLKAAQSVTDALGTRLTAAETTISGHDAAITQAVTDITKNGNDISYQAGQIQLMTDEYHVKLDNNGHVAGFGLYNGGATSEFIVNVDKFGVIKANGTGGIKKPFTIDTQSGNVAIDGNLIVGGSVSAAKLDITALSAITANLGTVTAGVIRDRWSRTVLNLNTGKFTVSAPEGITVNGGGGILIKGGGGIKVDEGGEIEFHSDLNYMKPAKVKFFDCTGAEAGALYANGNGQFMISPPSSDKNQFGVSKWGSIQLSARSCIMSGSDASGYATIETSASTKSIRLSTGLNGSFKQLIFDSAGRLSPRISKTISIGASNQCMANVYADNFINIADFYWLDERKDLNGNVCQVDDLEVIKSIKPSNHYDPISGLRIINDSTLPTWLVECHKNDGEVRNDEGERIQTWKAGDVMVDPDGKPYLSLKTMISLLMGAVRQLDAKIERIQNGK